VVQLKIKTEYKELMKRPARLALQLMAAALITTAALYLYIGQPAGGNRKMSTEQSPQTQANAVLDNEVEPLLDQWLTKKGWPPAYYSQDAGGVLSASITDGYNLSITDAEREAEYQASGEIVRTISFSIRAAEPGLQMVVQARKFVDGPNRAVKSYFRTIALSEFKQNWEKVLNEAWQLVQSWQEQDFDEVKKIELL
jgi:hypothetical protein